MSSSLGLDGKISVVIKGTVFDFNLAFSVAGTYAVFKEMLHWSDSGRQSQSHF